MVKGPEGKNGKPDEYRITYPAEQFEKMRKAYDPGVLSKAQDFLPDDRKKVELAKQRKAQDQQVRPIRELLNAPLVDPEDFVGTVAAASFAINEMDPFADTYKCDDADLRITRYAPKLGRTANREDDFDNDDNYEVANERDRQDHYRKEAQDKIISALCALTGWGYEVTHRKCFPKGQFLIEKIETLLKNLQAFRSDKQNKQLKAPPHQVNKLGQIIFKESGQPIKVDMKQPLSGNYAKCMNMIREYAQLYP
jgi:hypothetical protein